MTLYLSRLRLDPRNRSAATNLSRPYELHRTLLQAFPSGDKGGPGRVLFRSEPMVRERASEATIIVQSDIGAELDSGGTEIPGRHAVDNPRMPSSFDDLPSWHASSISAPSQSNCPAFAASGRDPR